MALIVFHKVVGFRMWIDTLSYSTPTQILPYSNQIVSSEGIFWVPSIEIVALKNSAEAVFESLYVLPPTTCWSLVTLRTILNH